jgi:hypothetical protein
LPDDAQRPEVDRVVDLRVEVLALDLGRRAIISVIGRRDGMTARGLGFGGSGCFVA